MMFGDEIPTSSTLNFKVLITTSGVGSRLGEYTKYTNKSLVAIGAKPAISRIIESYPPDTTFVITLGHFGSLIQDFLSIAYPSQEFEFVNVDNYDRPGSSLGLSMLLAKEYLQCPFIFHASDSLIGEEQIPAPAYNWIGGYQGRDAAQYTSFDYVDGRVITTHAKGMDRFDYIHIGILGISSYGQFWESLEKLYCQDTMDYGLNDLSAVSEMINKGAVFDVVEFKQWNDVGSITGLIAARLLSMNQLDTLEKIDESIYQVGKNVIKYFANKETCLARVQRAEMLAPHVPVIDAFSDNYYRYEFVEGVVLSKCLTSHVFKNLLLWAEESFWNNIDAPLENSTFQQVCKEFYLDKSIRRIEDFFSKSGYADSANTINGSKIPHILDFIHEIEATNIFDGQQGKIHGDFILDNLVLSDDRFIALDWREDFGGVLEVGDIYYDLAKMNHSLTMNHDLINKNSFFIEINKDIVTAEILRRSSFIECDKILEQFAIERGFDYRKINLITSLIWLNMAALHPHPLDLFFVQFWKVSSLEVAKSYQHRGI